MAYFGLDDQIEERLTASSLGGFSKVMLMILMRDGDKLKILAYTRTIQTVMPSNGLLREPLTTKRPTECMAVMLLSESHLFTCDRMEACRFSPRSHGKSNNCQGDLGQRAALMADEKNLAKELNNVSMSR
jgi:hypothetical protein